MYKITNETCGRYKMAGIMNKVLELFTSEDYEEDEEEVLNNKGYSTDYEEEEEETEGKRLFGGRRGKVVNMPQPQQIKMVISQPTSFEQTGEICQYLKDKKSCIVNLEYVNKDEARRIVDFISGGVFALDAHIQKVSNSIFLIAPTNYDIANETGREEIKNKLSVSWLK